MDLQQWMNGSSEKLRARAGLPRAAISRTTLNGLARRVARAARYPAAISPGIRSVLRRPDARAVKPLAVVVTVLGAVAVAAALRVATARAAARKAAAGAEAALG